MTLIPQQDYNTTLFPDLQKTPSLDQPATGNRWFEFALLVVFLLAMWGPTETAEVPRWLEYVRYIAFASICTLTALFGILKPAAPWKWRPETTLLLLLLGYAVVSVFWSDMSSFGISKAALLAITTTFCFSIARFMPLEKIVSTFFYATAISLILGIFFSTIFPSIGIETEWLNAGKWRGIAGQKNAFGAICALTLVVGMALPLRSANANPNHSVSGPVLLGRILLLLAAAVALFMSGSRGAQLSVVVGLITLAVAAAPRLIRIFLIGLAGVIGLAAAATLLISFDPSADKVAIFGLQIDNNSRFLLWQYGLDEFKDNPIFGLGLGGFWTEERTENFLRAQGWVLENFHSGYISALIEFGIVGLTLFLATLAAVFTVVFTVLNRESNRTYIAAACIIAMFVVSNVVENWLVRSTNFYLVIFVLLVLCIRRDHTQSAVAPADLVPQ